MVAQQPVGIVRSDNRKVAPEFLLSCSRAPEFPFPLVFLRVRISFFKSMFSHARFSSFPVLFPRAQVFFPLGVLARPNLSFQIAVLSRSIFVFPFAVFSCTLFTSFLVKFLGDRLSCFSLGVLAPLISHFSWVFTPALISPLLLVLPRAWVSLPRGVPVWPNLSFTVSIPARRIYPFSLRVRARANFTFPLGDFPFPFFVLVRMLLSFLLRGAFLPSVFPCPIFLFFRCVSRLLRGLQMLTYSSNILWWITVIIASTHSKCSFTYLCRLCCQREDSLIH